MSQQRNLKETFKSYTSSKAHPYVFCLFLKIFSSSFWSREQWSVFDETSCWNASHQCSCSSADFHAALCSSCTVFHISVVRNGLCRAHPNNRKVVRLTFSTAFIYKRVLFLIPNFVMESWSVGALTITIQNQHLNHTSGIFPLWLNMTVFSCLRMSFKI